MPGLPAGQGWSPRCWPPTWSVHRSLRTRRTAARRGPATDNRLDHVAHAVPVRCRRAESAQRGRRSAASGAGTRRPPHRRNPRLPAGRDLGGLPAAATGHHRGHQPAGVFPRGHRPRRHAPSYGPALERLGLTQQRGGRLRDAVVRCAAPLPVSRIGPLVGRTPTRCPCGPGPIVVISRGPPAGWRCPRRFVARMPPGPAETHRPRASPGDKRPPAGTRPPPAKAAQSRRSARGVCGLPVPPATCSPADAASDARRAPGDSRARSRR